MIPALTLSGFLPPFVGEDATHRAGTSPYQTTLHEVAERFVFSDERAAIFRGLLAYRSRLMDLGACDGFQLLDGSFFEDVEKLRRCPPDDIDVITFARLPFLSTSELRILLQNNLDLFDEQQTKAKFRCHAFFMDLNKRTELLVRDAMYFFGLFSHQRETALWKGLVAVPLADDADVAERLR